MNLTVSILIKRVKKTRRFDALGKIKVYVSLIE